jgi:hypothetical protein
MAEMVILTTKITQVDVFFKDKGGPDAQESVGKQKDLK